MHGGGGMCLVEGSKPLYPLWYTRDCFVSYYTISGIGLWHKNSGDYESPLSAGDYCLETVYRLSFVIFHKYVVFCVQPAEGELRAIFRLVTEKFINRPVFIRG